MTSDYYHARFRRISTEVCTQHGMSRSQFRDRIRARMVEAGEDYMQSVQWDAAAVQFATSLGVTLERI